MTSSKCTFKRVYVEFSLVFEIYIRDLSHLGRTWKICDFFFHLIILTFIVNWLTYFCWSEGSFAFWGHVNTFCEQMLPGNHHKICPLLPHIGPHRGYKNEEGWGKDGSNKNHAPILLTQVVNSVRFTTLAHLSEELLKNTADMKSHSTEKMNTESANKETKTGGLKRPEEKK